MPGKSQHISRALDPQDYQYSYQKAEKRQVFPF
jgi:hypothetical protein